MINKLKILYPNYLILIKTFDNLCDIHNNKIKDLNILNDTNYIIITENSYEVHKKTK